MPKLQCPIHGCGFETADVDIIGAAAILNTHAHAHTFTPAPTIPKATAAPKLDRPKLQLNATLEEWNSFVRRWDMFCKGSNIPASVATSQVLECAVEQLRDIVLRADPNFASRDLPEALLTVRKYAVVPVALGVLRAELFQLKQNPDEPFRTYAAKVQGKAETCAFSINTSTECSN